MKKKNNDEFAKAKNDIKKVGIFTCCLIGLLLIISLFIDTEKSYAADFLSSVPETFTSVISEVTDLTSFQELIKDANTGNKIRLPKEFSGKAEDGTFISYIYCMDRRLDMAGNITYIKDKSVKEAIAIAPDQQGAKNPSGETTTAYPGLIYILQNHDTLGGDEAKNYYYTQIAVWWYVDRANGLDDTKNYNKTTGAVDTVAETDGDSKYDDNGYKYLNNLSVLDKTMLNNDPQGKAIKGLVDAALAHAKDYPTEKQEKNVVINAENISLKVAGNYVETDLIKVTSTNTTFESYDVDLDTEITGYEIVDENNKLLNTTEIAAGQSFKIRIPVANVKNNSFKAKVYVTGYFKDWYDAYVYNTNDSGVQRALLGEIEKQALTVSTDIEPKKIDTPDTALSATVVYIAGGLIIAFGILLIVVAMKPNNAKKNK